MSQFLPNLIAFGRLLRQSGLPADTGRLIDAAEALQQLDLGARDDMRWAMRSLLVTREEELAIFDRLFDEFFGARRATTPNRPADATRANATQAQAFGDGEASSHVEEVVAAAVLRSWSDVDRLSERDFAQLSADELARARAAIAQLSWNPGERRTRRWVAGRGPRIDLRRAVAGSLRTAGEIAVLPRRRRRLRPRPIVLLCDVSGSMELYSRTLLHFAHAISRSERRVEAFLFATRLTRVTMALRSTSPDAAITTVSRAVRDWSGGTRIGEALRTFHQRWRRQVLPGSAVVILISDGWDRGDPQVLRDEIARLQRRCHRLIWLNPLIGTAGYAPRTRGLEAALPFVDDFLPVRTLKDVRELALHLSGIDHHGNHRHLHVRRPARARLGADAGSADDRVLPSGM